MINGDMPANPQNGAFSCADDFNSSDDMGGSGLTKREHFAAMAMQGAISNTNIAPTNKEYATTAVALADALLKALDQ